MVKDSPHYIARSMTVDQAYKPNSSENPPKTASNYLRVGHYLAFI